MALSYVKQECVEQRALNQLHEDFPILNDLDTQVEFSAPEGATTPQHVEWRCARDIQAHLRMLGVAEKVQHIIRSFMLHRTTGGLCEGIIEFHRGRVAVMVAV